jgi:hypothetical protein
MDFEKLLDDLDLNLTAEIKLPMGDIYTVIAALFAGGLVLIIVNKVMLKVES